MAGRGSPEGFDWIRARSAPPCGRSSIGPRCVPPSGRPQPRSELAGPGSHGVASFEGFSAGVGRTSYRPAATAVYGSDRPAANSGRELRGPGEVLGFVGSEIFFLVLILVLIFVVLVVVAEFIFPEFLVVVQVILVVVEIVVVQVVVEVVVVQVVVLVQVVEVVVVIVLVVVGVLLFLLRGLFLVVAVGPGGCPLAGGEPRGDHRGVGLGDDGREDLGAAGHRNVLVSVW